MVIGAPPLHFISRELLESKKKKNCASDRVRRVSIQGISPMHTFYEYLPFFVAMLAGIMLVNGAI